LFVKVSIRKEGFLTSSVVNDETINKSKPKVLNMNQVNTSTQAEKQAKATGLMNTNTGLELRSLIKSNGELEISLIDVAIPEPKANEVVVRIEASPLNPSDIGLLFGAADVNTFKVAGTPQQPILTGHVPPQFMPAMAGRLGQLLPVGNEGAGCVVSAGSSVQAQKLMGKMVAILGGAMYAQYRAIDANECLVLAEGTTAAQGASSYINPLTALGMVQTMRQEGHTALVHTVGASNLGQMLNRICLKDGIGLVNIVRKQEQVDLLLSQGAVHVCNASAPDFLDELTIALEATGATLAFDAIGGGKLAGQILQCMEKVINSKATEYSRYGSNVHKQVYIYGGLDLNPIELPRNIGMTWGVGGWLVFPFLKTIDPVILQKMYARVISELTTTFASHYTQEVSLAQALSLEAVALYKQPVTNTKFLITP
jgi:NADPH2:quinone reductase